ncbi:MAG: peptidoglycan DD-metalloendopeptidase family protein [Anaerolineae bacterium]|nr:peptidoglycan DD-metalloendopeptidase family protein [Anaerolineae bacterium]
MHRPVVLLLLLALLTSFAPATPVSAQGTQQDCGVVDAIDYPIDGISRDHDDFGIYRQYFSGYHTGIDMAFRRQGEPVHAAAKGRVTFSDIAGWDTEKGVVIIEHQFPDGNTYFTLYGHMEESETIKFPRVGTCIERGTVVGVVGNPLQSAPHLHYEIRTMRASTGGPGYWSTDPLDGGWLHPIDFTEQWRLRFKPEFRSVITATTALIMPPLWQADGSAFFAEQNYLEQRDSALRSLWRVNLRGLIGAVALPDGSVLGRTITNQIVQLNAGRYVAAWTIQTPLRSAPFLLGDALAFISESNSVIAYNLDSTIRWQTALTARPETYVQSGSNLAITAVDSSGYKLWVINPAGELAYQATAPAPITPISLNDGSFLILVSSQIALLGADMSLSTLMDVGQPLLRDSQIVRDAKGDVFLYPGQGSRLYGYDAAGMLRWEMKLPVQPNEPPLLALGTGCLLYSLQSDGSLLALNPEDGSILARDTVYPGGNHHMPAVRFLRMLPNEQVQFSAGYLSIFTIDGPTFGGVDAANCVAAPAPA